jgi:hypothetical protein
MKCWNESVLIEFNFCDAHDLRPVTDRARDGLEFRLQAVREGGVWQTHVARKLADEVRLIMNALRNQGGTTPSSEMNERNAGRLCPTLPYRGLRQVSRKLAAELNRPINPYRCIITVTR